MVELALSSMWFSKQRTVKCPNGRMVRVFKDPKDAFPLYTENWSGEVKLAVDAASQLQAEASAAVAKQLSGFLVRINDANSSLQMRLTAIYSVVQMDPCGRVDWYADQVLNELEREDELQRIDRELKTLRSLLEAGRSEAELLTAIEAAMTRLDQTPAQVEETAALSRARSSVVRWRERGETSYGASNA